jgi:pectin-derived oligosaccharide transport system permease protein
MMWLSRRARATRNEVLFQVFLFALGFIMIYPVLWMIANSFKPSNEIFGSASLMPSRIVLDNYTRGWRFIGRITFTTFYANSLFYVGLSTIGTVFSSAVVAFGFARVRFVGRNFWFACMFVTLILPFQVIMIPQFIIFQKLNWVNTFAPLIVPAYFGQAFFIFLMVQFIRGIPAELDESAYIDGCNMFRIFRSIIFPLITPAIITTTIFSFYWRWDDFLGPLLYLSKPSLFTVSVALRMFSDPMTSTDWGAIFAMATVSLVPILVVFMIFQKHLVQGISTTGLKS